MGLVQVLRRLTSWGWFWSGCPLVVLLAVPALVMQTRHLAGPDYDPTNECGARWVWRGGTFQPKTWIMTCFIESLPPELYLIEDPDQIRVLPQHEAEIVLSVDDLSRCSLFTCWPTEHIQRGLWAKTRRITGLPLPTTSIDKSRRPWTADDLKPFMPLLEEAYQAPEYDRWRAANPDFVSLIQQRTTSTVEPIYAGYAHNALALFLLGMTGRGVFGSRRWWRAFKARFRSKKSCCIACGYDLCGLTRGRCPECGERFTADVGRCGKGLDQLTATGV